MTNETVVDSDVVHCRAESGLSIEVQTADPAFCGAYTIFRVWRDELSLCIEVRRSEEGGVRVAEFRWIPRAQKWRTNGLFSADVSITIGGKPFVPCGHEEPVIAEVGLEVKVKDVSGGCRIGTVDKVGVAEIKEHFVSVLFEREDGYVDLERYYCSGSKFATDGVWGVLDDLLPYYISIPDTAQPVVAKRLEKEDE